MAKDRTTDVTVVRAATELTVSYVACSARPMAVYRRMAGYFTFVKGSATNFQAKVQTSDEDEPAAGDWHDVLDADGSALAPTLASANATVTWGPHFDLVCKWARFMVKCTGTVTSNTLAVDSIEA